MNPDDREYTSPNADEFAYVNSPYAGLTRAQRRKAISVERRAERKRRG